MTTPDLYPQLVQQVHRTCPLTRGRLPSVSHLLYLTRAGHGEAVQALLTARSLATILFRLNQEVIRERFRAFQFDAFVHKRLLSLLKLADFIRANGLPTVLYLRSQIARFGGKTWVSGLYCQAALDRFHRWVAKATGTVVLPSHKAQILEALEAEPTTVEERLKADMARGASYMAWVMASGVSANDRAEVLWCEQHALPGVFLLGDPAMCELYEARRLPEATQARMAAAVTDLSRLPDLKRFIGEVGL
jgi:hypothetical protein